MNLREQFLLDVIVNGRRKTWAEYGEAYNSHQEKVRKWWREFKGKYADQGLLFPGRKMTSEEKGLWARFNSETQQQERSQIDVGVRSTKYSGDNAEFEGLSDRDITSLEELVKFFKVDEEIWMVKEWVCNVWQSGSTRTVKAELRGSWDKVNLYQVKARLVRRDLEIEVAISDILEKALDHTPKRKIRHVRGNGKIATVCISDLHLGAQVKDLVRTPNFDIGILIEKLRAVADKINSYGFSEVHLNILGDLIESFSGLNHPSTFKSLGYKMYGSNLLILADAILNENLISRIDNLIEVNIVAGNHDRVTPARDVDNEGEFAGMFAYLLKRTIGHLVNVEYGRHIMVKEIDGIRHILTHGDKAMNKKDVAKMILDFGGGGDMYTILWEGHYHTRRATKTFRSGMYEYHNVDVYVLDEMKYRKITVASLFTGNLWSEMQGLGGTSGFSICVADQGHPDIYDLTVR